MELFLSDKNSEFSHLSHVLIQYLNLSHIVKVTSSIDSSYLSENSKTETNFTSIIQQITKKSPFHKILFGKDDDESNQVLKFIKDLDTMKLEEANKLLETRTYIINEHISICDLMLYIRFICDLNKLSDKDKILYCNLARFADFMMHLPGLEDNFAKRGLIFNLAVENKWVNLNDSLLTQNVDAGKKKMKKEDKFKAKEEFFKKQEENKKGENEIKSDISINTKTNDEKKTKENKKAKEEKKQETTNDKRVELIPNEEKKTEPKKEQKQPAKKVAVSGDEMPAISKLDLRVGKIVKIWPNPDSDKLYNEEIDIGNGEIRTIASGLKKRIPIDILQDSYVIVLCNLKARKLCNYLSHGMVNFIFNLSYYVQAKQLKMAQLSL